MEPWELAKLPELVRPEVQTENKVQEETLWDHWGVMMLFFFLLTAEWIIRKMNGLP